ncbi:hypothetical protein ACFLY8_00675, partial [Halobacteriota archaeon]
MAIQLDIRNVKGVRFFLSILLAAILVLSTIPIAAVYAQPNTIGSEFQVNTYTYDQQSYPSAAMDADGNFVITWTSYGQDGSGSGIYAQMYDISGSKVGSEFQVNTYTTDAQRNPSVAMDADGNFVITWMSYGPDGHWWGIFAQMYDSTGSKVGSEFRVNTYTTYEQMYPSVAMDA